MSKDIDKTTMDALAAAGDNHNVNVDLDGQILMSGSINIPRNAEGLARARELAEQVQAVIAKLGALLLLGFVLVAGAGHARAEGAYAPRTAAERDWGGLDKAELTAIHDALLKQKPKKIEIYCGGNFCRSLAEDLDEAFESAGYDSYLPVPMFDLGKGLAISPANDETKAIAAAIKKATGGRVNLEVIDQSRPIDHLIIAIGRKKAK